MVNHTLRERTCSREAGIAFTAQSKQRFETQYTWFEGFRRNVERYATKEALIDPETNRTWSYEALYEESCRLCQGLQHAGCRQGDVLMVQLHNCPEFVFAYLACHQMGMVFSPVNFRLPAGEVASCMALSRPAVFLTEPALLPVAEQALQSVPDLAPILLTASNGKETGTYDSFVRDFPAEEPMLSEGISAFAESLRLFTSGTTGVPKAVSLADVKEVLSAHDVMMQLSFSAADRSMNTTPWFHRGGLHACGITPTLYAGGTVVIQRRFRAAQTLDAIRQYGLTFVVGVPNVLELLAQEQLHQSRDLSSLRGLVTMGSPLERNSCMRYQEILTPLIYNGYGTTETFGIHS